MDRRLGQDSSAGICRITTKKDYSETRIRIWGYAVSGELINRRSCVSIDRRIRPLASRFRRVLDRWLCDVSEIGLCGVSSGTP
jgi:hypothetical protein